MKTITIPTNVFNTFRTIIPETALSLPDPLEKNESITLVVPSIQGSQGILCIAHNMRLGTTDQLYVMDLSSWAKLELERIRNEWIADSGASSPD